MVNHFSELVLSIEIMMFGNLTICVEKKNAVNILISKACDGYCTEQKEYNFDLCKYNDFVSSIFKIISELTFDEGLCEYYDKDDGLNWNLTINSELSINSSEKSEILNSVIDVIESIFPIDGEISSFLNS